MHRGKIIVVGRENQADKLNPDNPLEREMTVSTRVGSESSLMDYLGQHFRLLYAENQVACTGGYLGVERA